jgi:isocitrate dehydrogenase
MVDGFWIVQVQGPLGNTGGVVVFINGKLFGGDSGFSYIGTYEGDKMLKARIAVQHFDPAVQSILGVPGDYEMHVSANVQGDVMSGTAMLANQPQRSVGIRLTKKANL